MKRFFIGLSTAAFLVAGFSAPSVADIHEKATSTSHQLEEAGTALHSYMHHAWPSSYGAHGMEATAGALHDALHDWGHGEATEDAVLLAVGDVQAALDDMREQFRANGVWADHTAKKLYDDCHRLTVLVTAYTN